MFFVALYAKKNKNKQFTAKVLEKEIKKFSKVFHDLIIKLT